jgi:single-strand DNA-binding protein
MGCERMGAAELTQAGPPLACALEHPRARVHARRVAVAYAGLWTFTCVGVLVGAAAPGLAPGGHPHPTLHGTLGEVASIAIANARVLSAPFLLALFRFPSDRRSRQLGDLLVVVLLAGNALRVGLALGRDRGALLPYLPQLPLEWLAAALAAAGWLTLRTGARKRTGLAYVAGVLVSIAAAAAIETICTPHAATRGALPGRGSTRGAAITRPDLCAEGQRWLVCAGSCAGAGSRFKVAPLPSPRYRSVPLGRLASAAGLRQPPPDPAKEGPGMNAVHLIGRLTQDVELRERGETKVAQLRLAVPRSRDKNGEDRGADFVDVVCFGRQAEVCANYLGKGRRIAVEGRLHHDEWDGENGRRQKLEVIAQSVEFLDSKRTGGEVSEEAEPVAA